ncbi:hypothetical protein [Deinococcus frigens]|uniref:hypothetical protein n=1 Tax=Deinococcus frigens TaxID=249403 RepID=UPI000496C830|nr:hypothetical protein [Deinococcus frigens]
MKKALLSALAVILFATTGTSLANMAGPNTRYCTNYLQLGPDFGMDTSGCVFATGDELGLP